MEGEKGNRMGYGRMRRQDVACSRASWSHYESRDHRGGMYRNVLVIGRCVEEGKEEKGKRRISDKRKYRISIDE